MTQAGSSTKDPDPDAGHTYSADLGRSNWWISRHNAVVTLAAASVTPILYVLFVDHYAINSFFGDDWSVVLLVHASLHGHLSWSQLWGQYNESRLFMGNIVSVLLARADRFDLRLAILFNAILFIAAYGVLLALLRQYLGRRLTPILVLVIGVIWFSPADVQNSLWAFQISWYLTVLCFMVVLFALFVPNRHRTLWFAVAVTAASAASLSTVQGFLCWPLGAICIAWSQPWARRAMIETTVWLGTMILLLALYLPGYNFSNNGCFPAATCSPRVAFHHPLTALTFFFAVIGNVIPGGVVNPVHNFARFEVVGAVLFAAAVFILVRSWHSRVSADRTPLPFLLIAFALAFDLTIALGRSASGASGAVNNNRYVMANLILLTGIVIYAWSFVPALQLPPTDWTPRFYATVLTLLSLAILVVIQTAVAIGFGQKDGQASEASRIESAQLLINQDSVPSQYRGCELYAEFFEQPGLTILRVREAAEDQLGEFRPSSYERYRIDGPPSPALFPECSKTPATTRPQIKGSGMH